MTTKATLTRKRNSRIQTEAMLMYERVTGKAPDVHSETYRRWVKQTQRYIAPVLIQQEQQKGISNVSKSRE